MNAFNTIRFVIKIMEGLACTVGFMYWARLKPNFWKSLPIYLLIITVCEFAGWYMTMHGLKGSKILYNYFVIPFEFLFIYFLYFKNFSKKLKPLVLILSIVYLLVWIIELTFLKNIKWSMMSASYSLGNLIVLILGITYFLQLLKSDKVLAYKNQIFYWINLGLMLFYVGTFPYYALFRNLVVVTPNLFMALSWVDIFLDIGMYIFFIIGILCNKTKS